ncbi:hypothetical protein AAE02nite_22880 [Adhaeribacter aerolatus]|uniref:Glycosyl transferase family 1 domain-containing protein n=1 Tax=Adhaeribacter aerolatus TaxID=670289 RepID=A0A512AY45_9BACT|nr:glycosyltransferase family 1 protein [Adhaeribacter aerolatus]GEO04624.1 hypothetical protein AAE02nite_22880 [Adhaeribacter aerolatus]
MKIAIDCRALRKSPSGIPNFIVSAINGLASENPSWQFYLLSNEPFHPALLELINKKLNLQIIISPLPFLNNISILWLLFKVNKLIKEINPDLYWAPAFLLPPRLPKKVKTMITVHDMVFKQYKNTMSFTNRLIFEILHDWSIKSADLLWSNSKYTANGIAQYFPEKKSKAIFTGFFINTNIFKPASLTLTEQQELKTNYNLQDNFILFVGTLEPRKNLSFLLSLLPELAAMGFSLLVIGAKGWGETKIEEVVEAPGFPKDRVTFAGFVSTDTLVKLYSLATVYVSTSLNEGFGMPQLEAMACGCPVVSPHNSAMIEVVEGAGETVKTWHSEDWIAAINRIIYQRSKYVELGFMRVKCYERKKILLDLNKYMLSQLSNNVSALY